MAEETVRRRFIVLSYDIIKWLSEEKVIDNPKLSMTAANRRALRWEIKSTQSKLNTCSVSKNAVYLEAVASSFPQTSSVGNNVVRDFENYWATPNSKV